MDGLAVVALCALAFAQPTPRSGSSTASTSDPVLVGTSTRGELIPFQCTEDVSACYVSVHWPSEVRTIPYVIRVPRDSKLDRNFLLQTIKASFATWSEPSCTDLAFEFHGFLDADDYGPSCGPGSPPWTTGFGPDHVLNQVLVVTHWDDYLAWLDKQTVDPAAVLAYTTPCSANTAACSSGRRSRSTKSTGTWPTRRPSPPVEATRCSRRRRTISAQS
jgi:hypothetical protein